MKRSLLYNIFKKEKTNYLFDGRTYAIIEIDDLHKDVLDNWNNSKKEIISKLQPNYQVDDIITTHNNISEFINQGIISTNDDLYIEAPLFNKVILTLTDKCNLSCKYCFESKDDLPDLPLARKTSNMSKKIALSSLDYLFKYSQLNELTIQFYGGEPLLNFSVLKYATEEAEILKKKHKKDIRYYIITNGTLINEEIASFFAKYNFSVQVSMDGNKTTHDENRIFCNGKGSYDCTYNGLTLLKKFKVNYNIMSVVTKTLLENSNSWIRNIKKLSNNSFAFCSATTSNKNICIANSQFKLFKKIYKNYLEDETENYTRVNKSFYKVHKAVNQINNGNHYYFGCGAGLNEVTIAPEGNIFLCERMEGNTKVSVEDDEDIFDLWHAYARNVLNEKCSFCWVKYLCGGGCAHAFSVCKKTFYEFDCEKIKLEVETAINYLINEQNRINSLKN